MFLLAAEMSGWLVTLLTGAAGVLISLIITFAFNGVINLPKKKREKEAEQEQAKAEFFKRMDDAVKEGTSDIQEELKKQQVIDSELKESVAGLKIYIDGIKNEDLRLIRKGLQATIKDILKIRYEEWFNRGYAPKDNKEDLEIMYNIYHSLGENGVMDKAHERFLKLPDKPPRSKSNKNQ